LIKKGLEKGLEKGLHSPTRPVFAEFDFWRDFFYFFCYACRYDRRINLNAFHYKGGWHVQKGVT